MGRASAALRNVLRAGYLRLPRRSIQQKYSQYSIGRWTYGTPRVLFKREGPVLSIGAFCSIADRVTIFLGGEHRPDWASTYPFSVKWPSASGIEGYPRIRGDVVIGNDVWIGAEAMIMSGVTVGDGAVIGARALVARDVPPYAVVAGNPATVTRMRFRDDQISRLMSLKWWDWPDSKIERFIPLMSSDDLDLFLDAAEAPSSSD